MPDLSAEAEIVLDAIAGVNANLDSVKESQNALRSELKSDARSRFRQVLAIIAMTSLLLTGAAVGYVQYDRVSRCHSRADTIATIKRVIAKDHDALPKGLLQGFGDTADLRHVVAVIRASYNDSEQQIDLLLPAPDCSGFLP